MKNLGRVYEKRGDDHFDISSTEDGKVIQISQYDSGDAFPHYNTIFFWAETAPKLFDVIRKKVGTGKKKATELAGSDVGRVCVYTKIDGLTGEAREIRGIITMITHKKNKDVNVRIAPNKTDLRHGDQLLLHPDYEVEIT